jgi:hypothetical protein
MDSLQGAARGVKHLVEGCQKVVPEVHAIGNLDRVGGALPGAVRLGSGPLPGDDADARMGLSPPGEGLRLTIGQKGERPMPLEIDPHRPLRRPFPKGPVVDAEHLGWGDTREGQTT